MKYLLILSKTGYCFVDFYIFIWLFFISFVLKTGDIVNWHVSRTWSISYALRDLGTSLYCVFICELLLFGTVQ